MGRSDVNVLGGDVSFFGFLAILLLRCSPLAMVFPWVTSRLGSALMLKHKAAGSAALSGGKPAAKTATGVTSSYLTSVTNCSRGRRTFFRFANQSPSVAR